MIYTKELLQAAGCDAYEAKKYFEHLANKAKEKKDNVTRRVYLKVVAKVKKHLDEVKAAEKQMKYFTLDQVIDNPEIPENIQLDVLEINEYNRQNGHDPVLGVGIEPVFQAGQKLTWWIWDNGATRRWFNKDGELATPIKTAQGWYFSAVSTYIKRIRKGLPLYAAA